MYNIPQKHSCYTESLSGQSTLIKPAQLYQLKDDPRKPQFLPVQLHLCLGHL